MKASKRAMLLLAGMLCSSIVAASDAAPAKNPTAVDVIAQLYREYAWEAIMDEPEWPGHDLFEQPVNVLRRYFDEPLAALIVRDRECVARTGEMCKLDYAPLWDSQDPGASELKVLATNAPNRVLVTFVFPGDGSQIKISYIMTRTPAGWRIKDIVGTRGNSLFRTLSR